MPCCWFSQTLFGRSLLLSCWCSCCIGVDVSHLEEEFNKTKLQLLDTVRKEKTAAQLTRRDSSPPPPASPAAAAEAREAPLPDAAPSPPAQSNERLLTPSKYRHMNRKEFGVQAGTYCVPISNILVNLQFSVVFTVQLEVCN